MENKFKFVSLLSENKSILGIVENKPVPTKRVVISTPTVLPQDINTIINSNNVVKQLANKTVGKYHKRKLDRQHELDQSLQKKNIEVKTLPDNNYMKWI